MSWLELGYIHPLTIDVMFVNVAAINGDSLVTVISAFVSEMAVSGCVRVRVSLCKGSFELRSRG